MTILNEISQFIQQGRAKNVQELIKKSIDDGIDIKAILNQGLISGMNVVGEKFKKNEFYVPDVLLAARAMNSGMEILKPLLAKSGVEPIGTVVIGTVKGDLHDIGKNLVKMMMEGKGLKVIDLGVDVSADKFVNTAIKEKAQIIACSALLTTTMGEMEKVVQTAKDMGIRNNITIMVGGAPLSLEFCKSIDADIYTPDAATASDEAENACFG